MLFNSNMPQFTTRCSYIIHSYDNVIKGKIKYKPGRVYLSTLVKKLFTPKYDIEYVNKWNAHKQLGAIMLSDTQY